jgi:23S rRNA (guanosine2251-2'-O)-methyltransferase
MDEKRRAGKPGERYNSERPRRTYQGVNLGKGRHRPDFKEEREQDETMLEGKNAVQEALSSGTEIDKILFSGGSLATVGSLVALARQKGIPAQEVDKRKLDRMSITGAHQGIIAFKAAVAYSTVEDMLKRAEAAGQPPLLVLCDGITDPHNLGAIIRTAEVVGAHGVIIPKKKSAGLNAACAKAAAGALEHLPVCKCQNIQVQIQELREKGIPAWAADMAGQTMYEVDMRGPTAIVIGAEGSGISPEVRKLCQGVISIPQIGRIESLNASNAAAVLLYEAHRQRTR